MVVKSTQQVILYFLLQTWAPDKARAITEDEKKHCAFAAIRKARSNAKLWGIRAKRKKEKEEAAAQAKPKKR